MINCILVGIGGFIGTACRYLIGLIPLKTESGFPVKTFLINIFGAFLISLITALAAKNKSIPPQLILMLKVGICGGFTTFSTFAFETAGLLQNGKIFTALLYAIGSSVFGVLAVFAAQMIAS